MTVACPQCDLLQRLPDLPPGGKACCVRCEETLLTRPVDPLGRPLALTLAAAIAFVIVITAPLMGLSAVGRSASTSIATGVYEMWTQGEPLAALMVAFCALVAPGLYIGFMLAILIAARRPPAPRWVGKLLRWATFVRPWSMSEVMILGILVALIKIAELATVEPGVGMYAVGVMIVLLAAIGTTFEPAELWKRVEWAER